MQKLLYKRENNHVLSPKHTLKPGLNFIPKAEWEKHKAHPAVQAMYKSGVLFDVADKAETADLKPVSTPSTAQQEQKPAVVVTKVEGAPAPEPQDEADAEAPEAEDKSEEEEEEEEEKPAVAAAGRSQRKKNAS